MLYRIKCIIEEVIAIVLKLFCIFPICDNRIIFSAYSGRSFSCNPKYIYCKLQQMYPDKFDVVWAFNEPEKFYFLKDEGVKIVKYKSVKYIYYVFTSRFYVDNVEHWSVLRFRKGQHVINTWHGGGTFKQVGTDRADTNVLEKKHVLKKMSQITSFVSSSRAFEELTLKGSFSYKGFVLKTGMPRNDLLVNEFGNKNLRKSILEKLNITEDTHVLLYAPTFRKSGDVPTSTINFSDLLVTLKDKFGGQWKILLRGHYYMKSDCLSTTFKIEDYQQDVSSYADMQELLLVADVLVTDYSSSMWDFSLMKKPVLLFTPDVDQYINERTFYWPIDEWPYSYSKTNESLLAAISSFDADAYNAKVVAYMQKTESYETGSAAEQICNYIDSKMQ